MSLTTIVVTAAGGDGTSVGDTTVAIADGYINAVAVDIAGAPVTVDVLLTLVGPGAIERVLLTWTDLTASVGLVALVNDAIDEAGAADTGAQGPVPVTGSLRVNVAQADDSDIITVYILHEDLPPVLTPSGSIPTDLAEFSFSGSVPVEVVEVSDTSTQNVTIVGGDTSTQSVHIRGIL